MKRLYAALLFSAIIGMAGARNLTAQNIDGYRVTGPHAHKNLAVFLIHGRNRIDGTNFISLQEAMDRKAVVVHETGSVNQLMITNNSKANIFIMSGDIVKGGKQDRVIQYNYIVPPKTEKMPINSFCVESGRWEKREGENLHAFTSSNERIASKDLKMSVKKEKSQSGVWNGVSRIQDRLGEKVGEVRGSSETSLQLTLEHEKLKKARDEYARTLAGIIRGQKDVVGYAFAINGKINSAEIFASSALFAKLWAKLVNASIVEAISDYRAGAAYKKVDAGDIRRFLREAEKGNTVSDLDVSKRTRVIEKETPGNLLYETRDSAGGDRWINRSYMAK
ncbi:MAG: hypothetical protein JW838_15875 [Spirochaetes bacterium]|nr:hypothetical protein [Spirochaetota bacterium]